MPHARTLLITAGILLGCLVAPPLASAQATDPAPGRLAVGFVPADVTYLKGITGFQVHWATDPSGIAAVWLRVDGVEVASAPQPCGWGCDDLSDPVALSVDTARLGEGPHTFTLGVTDGDGYERVGMSRAFTVDNVAPGAPIPVTPLQVTTAARFIELDWRVPGNEPGVSAAKLTICEPKRCFADPFPSNHVSLPIGVTKVAMTLRDAAGNSDPAQVTTWTITRVQADPGLSLTVAKVGSNRRTITVGGQLKVPHTNKVSISVRAKIGRRTRTLRAIAVTSGNGFRTELTLPSANWRVAKVTARVAGTTQYRTVERTKTVRRPRG
jgi:hypothetical protein